MTDVASVRRVELNTIRSDTGQLTVLTAGVEVPFGIQRFFFIADMHRGARRADHAHKTCDQLLFSTTGAFHAVVRDIYGGEAAFDLTSGEASLYVPAGIWLIVDAMGDDTCIGVLASQPYDPADYVRVWDDFINQNPIS